MLQAWPTMNLLYIFVYLFSKSLDSNYFVEAALNDVGSVAFCVGKPGIIPWVYDDESRIDTVAWSKDGVQVMFMISGSLTKLDNKYELDTNTNAGLKVITVESSSVGSYTCSVGYQVGASLPDQDIVSVTVLDPPVGLSGNYTDTGCKCYITDLGTPAALLKIKVNDGSSQTPAEITSLANVDHADCCVEGAAVTCMPENTAGGTEYCVRACSPPPCRLYVCYIGVYVAVLSAVVILVVYFIVRCLFEILCGVDFFVKIVLPSCCCMLICIVCVVAICIPVEPYCDKGVGIGVPIVIVIILHPFVTVGVIVCHIKCWQGQDPGQPPQRRAEPQTRQEHGGTESNQGRPQPSQPHSGDEKHHSSVQKSNEEPFKPRKLPGIPADSKNARGLSANFDEVLPDKHRLTPLGQEARFDEFEETPKKKKKKKKSSEKDLDTSTDF